MAGDDSDSANAPAAAERRTFIRTIQTRNGGRAARMWSNATQGELIEAGRLERQARSDRSSDWRTQLDAVRGPGSATAAQREALGAIEATALGSLHVEWDALRRTPSDIRGIGYVRRSTPVVGVWREFLHDRGEQLRAAFGVADNSEFAVETSVDREDVSRLRISRSLDGIPVQGQFLEVDITTDVSPMGGGVVWKIHGVWDRDLRSITNRTPRSRWLTAERARSIVLPEATEGHVLLTWMCGAECRPIYSVFTPEDHMVLVDAISGERVAEQNNRHSAGPLYIRSLPPNATSPTPVAFLGANWRNASTNAYIDATDLRTGAHYSSSSTAVSIGFEGPLAGSAKAPTGRITQLPAVSGTGYTAISLAPRVSWTPSSQPTQDFTSAWGANTTTFPLSTQVAWGLLSYWQNLSKEWMSIDFAESVAFRLGDRGGTMGLIGNSAACGGPLGGTAQVNSCTIDASVDSPAGDAIPNPLPTMAVMGHEFGHTLVSCNSETGTTCTSTWATSTQAGTTARLLGLAWRGEMQRNLNEIIPSVIGQVFTEHRDTTANWYNPDLVFETYDSNNDDHGTATQDINNSGGSQDSTFNCNTMGACPVGFSCLMPTFWPNGTIRESFAPAGSPGLCVRDCTPTSMSTQCLGPSGNWAGLQCYALPSAAYSSTAPSGSCLVNQYQQNVFGNAFYRGTIQTTWATGVESTLATMYGFDGNGARDFVHGTDSVGQRAAENYNWDRFEWTRALRSVVRDVSGGPAFTYYDDAPSRERAAIPVDFGGAGASVLWNRGATPGVRPTLTDAADVDYVLFRGVAGELYDFYTGNSSTDAEVYLEVWRWTNASNCTGTLYPNGCLIGYSTEEYLYETGAEVLVTLPVDDWYVIRVAPRSLESQSGSYELNFYRYGVDDHGNTNAAATPVKYGQIVAGASDYPSGDVDFFATDVPTPSSGSAELTIYVTGGTFDVYSPSGTLVASSQTSSWTTTSASTGRWTWKVHGGTSTYSTYIDLTCGGFGVSCFSSSEVRGTVSNSWGGRFTGFLNSGSQWHDYNVYLAQGENMSAGLSSNPGCALALEVYAPASMGYFSPGSTPLPVFRWTDGAAFASQMSTDTRLGIGGHLAAPQAGTYRLRVRSTNVMAGCNSYLLEIAKHPGLVGLQMPSWTAP